jgi:hypothetical protein
MQLNVKVDPSGALSVLDNSKQIQVIKNLTNRIGRKSLTIMKDDI